MRRASTTMRPAAAAHAPACGRALVGGAALLITACLLLPPAGRLAAQPAEAAPPGPAETSRQERLAEMRRRAEATHVAVRSTAEGPEATLLEDPLFRFSDQPRNIVDATLWGWSSGGRPAALQKVELYQYPDEEPRWFYCFVSLDDAPLDVRWETGEPWSSRGPGVTMTALPSAPAPHARPAARRAQLREIAGRFSADIIDPIARTRERMRLLPTPIHRYSDEEAGLIDGAIFGFASNGTNPDALLLVELTGSEDGEFEWRYGLAQMTAGELAVSLGKDVVWTAPYRYPNKPSRFDTWLFFRETPLEPR